MLFRSALIEIGVPASAARIFGTLLDDELCGLVQPVLHHVPRPRHIGGVRGAAIGAALHQHAVRPALAQHQQAVVMAGSLVRLDLIASDEVIPIQRTHQKGRKL